MRSAAKHKTEKESLHEINRYEDKMFPMGIYKVTRASIEPEGRGFLDLHWHEELQFTIVKRGRVRIRVNGAYCELAEGEAIFINKNALHQTDQMTDDAMYISLDVPEKILGFFAQSRMEIDCVRPITENLSFGCRIFHGSVEWERRLIALLDTICERFMSMRESVFTEYEVSVMVVQMWLLILRNIAPDELEKHDDTISVKRQLRVQKMLKYIQTHHAEKIKVSDIAGAGHVSEAECNRCFRDVVHESPVGYLVYYRYLIARDLLRYSDKSVTEIAYEVGFNDTSYFIKYFKSQTGITPKEYRIAPE